MPDRLLFSLMGLAAGLMIALALVWPQGLGARSPGIFGHAMAQKAAPVRAAATPDPGTGMLSIGPVAPASSAAPGAAR